MDFKKLGWILLFITVNLATAQVKIGENPNTINGASIVELESTDKALVLTRVSSSQMQGIVPLHGAMVYNTDTRCIHYFNGAQWTNLCDGSGTTGSFSFTDNGDGTFTLNDGNGGIATFNGAAETTSSLVDNLDGTYTYTDETGTQTIVSFTSTDGQNISTDGTAGNISIDNGNSITLNVDDGDADDQNEIQDLQFNSEVISLSDDPDATTIDLSGYNDSAAIAVLQADVDANETDADNAIALKEDAANKSTDVNLADATNTLFPTELAVKTYVDTQVGSVESSISTHITNDGDLNDTNEIQTLSKTGNTISLSLGGSSVNETITSLNQNTSTGVITYIDEASTPQTANIISSDTNNAISIGSDGGAYLKINLGGRWTNSDTSTNLNVNGTTAPIFGTQDYVDYGTNLYEVSGNTLIVKESGRYDIRGNLSLVGINSGGNRQRTNVNARIAVNGTPVGAMAASGYIRWASNHDHSSIHLNEILQLNANDVISIITYREANSGTVNFSGSDESSFMINKLR